MAWAHAFSTLFVSPFSRLEASVALPDTRDFPKELKTIGDHIRQARLERNLLIKDVAALVGVSPWSLHEWEHNHLEPYARKYPRILAFLGYYPFESETLGGKIKKYRFTHGLTTPEFGKLVGVAGCTVSSWERNKAKPASKEIASKLDTYLKTLSNTKAPL